MSAQDAEAPFRRFPAVLRRWSLRAIRHRLRLPARRRRWDRENRAVTAPYRIEDRRGRTPDGEGAVLALGDFSGRTGLARAGAYELERLRAVHPDIEVRDLSAAINAGAEVVAEDGPAIARLYLLSAPDTYPILLRAVPPGRVERAWRTGLWVWETPAFPAHWRFAVDLVDEIWTPSEYSRRAIAPSVGAIPVSLRPHAVAAPASSGGGGGPEMRRRLGIAADAFVGLVVMDIASCPARKNPWAHVAAWREAFGDDPARVLVLKLRVSRLTRVVLDELRALAGGAPGIRLLEEEMTDAGIAALQDAADLCLSLHRAEGYGLTIHEALAAGTPVLATDFSANAEYGPGFAGYLGLPWTGVPCRDWTGHYADAGFEWAEVDHGAAVRALRAAAVEAEARKGVPPKAATR